MNVHQSLIQQDMTDCTKGQSLLSLQQAQEIFLNDVQPIAGTVSIHLNQAMSRITAADITTDISLPRFDNSAMDGFGICLEDLSKAFPKTFQLTGHAAAGHSVTSNCTPGSAIRILTGARVPPDIAAIIPQEQVTLASDTILISSVPRRGANIRRRGEDILAGSIILPEGTMIDARHIAMLAAVGLTQIQVVRPLRIGLISTGDELADSGQDLNQNGIVDVNRPMLRSLMVSPMFEVTDFGICPDDPELLSQALEDAARSVDLVISSGGISGSETDCLQRAVLKSGGEYQRLRVAIRPGKPIAKGCIGAMTIIGLPGNPISALINFLLFARPALFAKLGIELPHLISTKARCTEDLPRRFNRSEFIPVQVGKTNEEGEPLIYKLGSGSSSSLSPLVVADGFALVQSGTGFIAAGERLDFYPFKSAFSVS